jgi:REP element-mobilizing transposase RayT
MSRTVNGEALFGQAEKEMLRKMLWQVADFSGVEVLAFCLMNNHFHVLARIPPADPVSDAELIRRYGVLFPKPTKYETASIEVMTQELKMNGENANAIRERLMARMGNVSAFMKTLKQRFSIWFNKSHNRFGPLWSDRFKSVLVEGRGNVLQTMAAYIDLNPVRAGIVNDPKDYRFCGYAEAVAGSEKAVQGLKFIVSGLYDMPVVEVLRVYRCMLFGKGGAAATGAAEIDRATAVRVLEKENGRLPLTILLRCRVRYFSEGAVLGSQAFVSAHLKNWKHRSKPQSVHAEASEPIVVLKNVRGQAYF